MWRRSRSATERSCGVVVADELAEDGQGAGQLVDRLGSQHGGADVEIGEQRAADLRAAHRAEPGLAGGRAALASMLGGQIDHPGFEQQPAQPEQLAASTAPHRSGQPRRRVDRLAERVEIVDGERTRWPAGEGDGERQHLSARRTSGDGGTRAGRRRRGGGPRRPGTAQRPSGTGCDRSSWRTGTRRRPGTVPTRWRTTPAARRTGDAAARRAGRRPVSPSTRPDRDEHRGTLERRASRRRRYAGWPPSRSLCSVNAANRSGAAGEVTADGAHRPVAARAAANSAASVSDDRCT